MKRANILQPHGERVQTEQAIISYIQFSSTVNGPFTEPDTIVVGDSIYLKMDVTPLDTVITEYWLDANRNGIIDTTDLNFTGDMLVDNGVGSTGIPDLDATQGVIIASLKPEDPPAMQIVVKATEGITVAYGILVFKNPSADFSLTGTVYDVDDGPIAGMFVGANASPKQIMTTTDVNGNYELQLDSGTYHIFVNDPFSRFSSTDTEMTIQGNMTKDFYVARYSSFIRGYVRNEHGVPIPDVGVGLQNNNGGAEVRTDVNGEYKLMVPAGNGRIGLSQDDLLPQYMGVQSHDFTIANGDSIVNNSISNFTCYSTNSIITGLVLENGSIPAHTYRVSAWCNFLNSYSESATNGLGMFSIPVRSDTDLNLRYNVWVQNESDEYPLPTGMYVDTSFWDVPPGGNVTFNIIPSETNAFDNFNGHNVGFSQELWEPYMYGNPFGNQFTDLIIDSTLHIQTHSQSGRSGAGVVTKKPYNLNDRDIRVLMNRTQMGTQNSVSILLAPEKRSGNAPDDFDRWLVLWTGDQGDPGWKLVENVNHTHNVLWETNSTTGTDIRFIFEGNSMFSLFIDETEQYHGTWTNNFSMAFIYFIQENEVIHSPTTVMFDDFRVRSRFSVDVREVEGETPHEFRLEQNYPNPFNPTTNFGFHIPLNPPSEGGHRGMFVTLKIYDVLCREVAEVVNKEFPVGNYSVTFDASELPSGVYYYQLRAGDFVETKKLVLMR